MKRIFIGSSTQALSIAHHIEGILLQLGATVTVWDNIEAFTAGNILIQDLFQVAHSYDAGVFILTGDENLLASSQEKIPRDNVLIEAGMFIGTLGEKAVALCYTPEVHKSTDFEGIFYIEYDEKHSEELKQKLKNWLNNNVIEHKGRVGEENVLMKSRKEIQQQWNLDSRLHIRDGTYRKIRSIKIMNLASNLLINPEIGASLLPEDMSLKSAIIKIMEETRANIELMLLEPNRCNLRDLQTKIANCRPGDQKGCLYSALATLYQNLSTDTIYARRSSSKDVLFRFYVMKTCMPFGIFNVEFLGEASKFDHVKVDLYSAALHSEDERRSFVIWREDDPDNYRFFVNNFDTIKNNPIICKPATIEQLRLWAKEWDKI